MYADFAKMSLKNITGRKFCRISYLKTVLESWIPEQKSYHLRFFGLRLFQGQTIIGMLNCPVKQQITLQKSWCPTAMFAQKEKCLGAKLPLQIT